MFPAGDYFSGIPVFLSAYLGGFDMKQTRFPKSRRKRIRKKWRKDRQNWTAIARPEVVMINGTMYCSAEAYANIKAQVIP